jgi:uncharacterized SAM-binding protein YcdF (DUF218 family)
MAGFSRKLRHAAIVLLVLALLASGGVWAFRHVGTWLVVQDPLEPAHAIVVLSGRMPLRALQAAEIYRQGYAAQVWITRPVSPAEQLEQMHINFVGEEFYNEKALMAQGVPRDAIRVLERPTTNTEDEVEAIAAALRRAGGSKAILVTSMPHTRRVKTIWKALVGEAPRAIVRYAPQDEYDGAYWWRNTHDAYDVAREVLGLGNAWAGFPSRPVRP